MIDFKQFRKQNNLTQIQAAEYFDVSQAFISQIELGERPIPAELKGKIKALKALCLLSKCNTSSHMISSTTGISEVEIENYRAGKTKPDENYAMILLHYFAEHTDLMSDAEIDESENEHSKLSKRAVKTFQSKISQTDTIGLLLDRIETQAKTINRLEMQVEELNKIINQPK